MHRNDLLVFISNRSLGGSERKILRERLISDHEFCCAYHASCRAMDLVIGDCHQGSMLYSAGD